MLERVKARAGRNSREGEGSTIRVVAMRTGLSLEALRAWERRYGFPKPARRPGSNRRLYSASEVAKLVAITRVLACGYRIGDVVGKSRAELDALAPETEGHAVTVEVGAVTVDRLFELLASDRVAELESHLRHAAFAAGPRRFVTELAHPFAVRVGEAWAAGALAIRHEHLATECLDTQLRHMLAAYQDMRSSPHVLLATLPGEEHTLALKMVALYLAVSGARPRLMGGQTPIRDLAEGARSLEVDAVGLTVTACSDRAATKRALKSLRKALPRRIDLWIGGSGAEALGAFAGHEGGAVRVVTSWAQIESAIAERRR